MSTTPTSSSTPAAHSTTEKSGSKIPKRSKRIILSLSPHLLARFPSAQPIRKASRSKPPIVGQPVKHDPGQPETVSVQVKDELERTPLPDLLPETIPPDPIPNPLKRKGIPGPKPGTIKRNAPVLDANGQPKPRGKPGPKKRIRIDGESPALPSGTTTAPHHKLGPKANQGAINAGLRALDRTGKPTRKWLRNGFRVKSFTGVIWEVSSWRAPAGRRMDFGGDGKSNMTDSSEDAKAGNASSMPSEKSISGGEIASTDAPADSRDISSKPADTVAL